MRLDRALVARKLARSRTQAQQLLAQGYVSVNGQIQTRASYDADDSATIAVVDGGDHYVSRAAHKLVGALDHCTPQGLDVGGLRALDAGASTGGFTQVLLERGVSGVIALDVGHGQLAEEIRLDPRVTVVERVNVRDLAAESPHAGVDLVVADLSFISLTLVIAPLVSFAGPHSQFLLMVKPQFEVGKEKVGRTGVVSNLADRAQSIASVVSQMKNEGLAIHDISRSALPGPHGNVEFFVWGSLAWQARTMTTDGSPLYELDDESIFEAINREVRKEG